jgi:hypothetical protein
MKTFNISDKGWLDVYQLYGVPPGTPLLIHSSSSSYVKISTTAEHNDYMVLEQRKTCRSSYRADYLWVEGDGLITIDDALPSLVSNFSAVDFPPDVFTSDQPRYRRMRVDPGQTSFFEGREYRIFKEISVPGNTSIYLKVIVPEDIILWDLNLELDGGAIRLSTIYNDGSVVETTPFSTPLTVFRKNNMQQAPKPDILTSVFQGGQITGGQVIDSHRRYASSNPTSRSTIGGKVGSERGVLPGTYYYRIQSLTDDTAFGDLNAWWEETPFN